MIRDHSQQSAKPVQPIPDRAEALVGFTDEQLSRVDPLAMNLLVARGIPELSQIDIPSYQQRADDWADATKRRIKEVAYEFHAAPHDWKNDLRFFRLGIMCWYIDVVLGVQYRESHVGLKSVIYTDPGDLFLHGVMDKRRGTCGNMSSLHVSLGWRLGWPVSLACIGYHKICRFDDGTVTHNIEATQTGNGGFGSRSDREYQELHKLPDVAIHCGSDLRAVTPREMLGLFFGLRARLFDNTRQPNWAERDYLLARSQFPQNRAMIDGQNLVGIQNCTERFARFESGHSAVFAQWVWCKLYPRISGIEPLFWKNTYGVGQ